LFKLHKPHSLRESSYPGHPRYVFDAEDPTLAFVLLPHPGGPHTPVADAQTRWIAEVFAGKSRLPPKARRVADAVGVGDYQVSCAPERRVRFYSPRAFPSRVSPRACTCLTARWHSARSRPRT